MTKKNIIVTVLTLILVIVLFIVVTILISEHINNAASEKSTVPLYDTMQEFEKHASITILGTDDLDESKVEDITETIKEFCRVLNITYEQFTLIEMGNDYFIIHRESNNQTIRLEQSYE